MKPVKLNIKTKSGSYQIIVGSKSEEDNFEFKELNLNSEILSLDKIIKKLKN